MDIRDYFDNTRGMGVLSTANETGQVNAAIYARPHVVEGEKLAFITHESTTYHNLKANPQALYLFREDGEGYRGKRLSLRMVGEDKSRELADDLRKERGQENYERYKNLDSTVLFFELVSERPLVGK